jgi:small subunit ribosomal protein S9
VSQAEQPEDEQRSEEQEPAAEETPQDAPAADESPAQEAPAADESPAQEAPAADETPAEQEAPPAEEAPPAQAPGEPEAPTGPTPGAEASAPEPEPEAPEAEAPEPEAPEAEAPETAAPETEAEAPAETPQASDEGEEVELAPRQRPEIPGADLIPDIVPEGEDQFLDAEARAAAEAEAEAAAESDDGDNDAESQPIAHAAIDLAAGARYTATGKRKTAVARVILKPGSGTYSINGKELDAFFPRETLQRIIRQPLETVGYDARMDVVARMHGGGVAAQAGALRHGISRALIEADPNLRGELKRRGFLTRDPRVKERKKAGLKKARKRPQFSKR